mgnify:FL=1
MSNNLVTSFHHVAVRSSDFDASVDFYQSVLGFTRRIEWGEAPRRAIMLNIGDAGNPGNPGNPGGAGILEIFEHPGEPMQETNPLLLHIAFRCSDVDAVIARVRELGMEVTVEPKHVDIPSRPTGPSPVRLAFFKGPDGEVIELFDSQAV